MVSIIRGDCRSNHDDIDRPFIGLIDEWSDSNKQVYKVSRGKKRSSGGIVS